jgi:uncharacterized membrane protein
MYDIELLQDPNHPSQQCDPQDIGAGARVVGVSDGGGPAAWVAMAWTRAAFAQAAAAGSQSAFAGVNSLHHAVGSRGNDNVFTAQAIFADTNGVVDLPVPAGGAAVDINDAGLVVGWDMSHSLGYAFNRATGTLSRIPAPAGQTTTYPLAINAAGEIVGVCGDAAPAFVHVGGTTRSLGPAYAADINNAGLACGFSFAPVGQEQPVTCDTRAATLTWTTLPLPPGFTSGEANGVNSAGHVVGSCRGANGASGAFIHAGGITQDLQGLIAQTGWSLVSAQAINDAGQIVGLADHGGARVGYVMSPVQPFRFSRLDAKTLVAILLGGVAVDGGGLIIIGGIPRPVGPWVGPLANWETLTHAKRDALIALALDEAARLIRDAKTRAEVRAALIKAASKHIHALLKDKKPRRIAKTAHKAGPAPINRKRAWIEARERSRR